MVRKRKVAIIDEEKENEENDGLLCTASTPSTTMLHGPMYTIMANIQLNETFHKKYIKEMKQLYEKMDHDAFMFTFVNLIKTAMEADEANEFSLTTLTFCSKFVSSFDGDDTHPLLIDSFKWLLSTVSRNPHIRYRLCQYVNMILKALGPEAALDDGICDRILEYMLERVCDVSPSVRQQAILAMQRLQVPDNPDDPVLRAYQFHLCSDPSPRVRQTVITCMGRNFNTIPYILDRLWDIDEKVRRHTYLHMSSFPVRSYKVAQRLTLLEQGLHDRCEAVRKVVVTIMLQQWIESYQKNLISLISALKLDANEAEIDRFRKITKKTLQEVFKRQPTDELLMCLNLHAEGEFHRCVPHEELKLETAFYWQCLTEYLSSNDADELDLVVPELSAFCAYVERYCQTQRNNMDKFEQMEFTYVLLSLMEILYTYDLGDETGRGNLKTLLGKLVRNYTLEQRVVNMIVKCSENLITDQNERLQFFIDIIRDLCELNSNDLLHNRNLISELLANCPDADLNLKLSSIKVKLLDLEEQEMNLLRQKDFVRAHVVTEEKNTVMEEYTKLLQPLLEKQQAGDKARKSLSMSRQVRNDSILKCLQLTFSMIASTKVDSINSNICQLYHDFICRHIASNQIAIRDWALKCGTAYSMLYEPLAKDVFEELYSQFFKNHNIRIWETSIACIFELLDRYGIDNFVEQEEINKTKKAAGGRQLYNTLEFLDEEEATQNTLNGQGVGVIYMMSHFLDTCDEICITKAIIKGFCQLILRGYIKNSDIIEKLLLRYFNPTIEPEINQMLGIFLKNLIESKRHSLLQPCLLPTISTVLTAPCDSPLHEIRPETIARFFIDFTRQESCANAESLHNKIAHSFLQEMLNNVSNKELSKLLSKELLTLDVNVLQNEELKQDMKTLADKLIKSEFDPKTIKNIIEFKDMLDGIFNPKLKPIGEENEESDDDDDDGTVITEKGSTHIESANAQTVQTTASTTILSHAETIVEEDENTLTDKTTEKPVDVDVTTDNENTIVPQVSPPKTMYGPDNSIRHRSLRKSMNLSREGSVNNKRKSDQSPTQAKAPRTRQQQKKAKETGSKTPARNRQREPSKSPAAQATKLRTRGRPKSKSKSPIPSKQSLLKETELLPTEQTEQTSKSPETMQPAETNNSTHNLSEVVHIVVYEAPVSSATDTSSPISPKNSDVSGSPKSATVKTTNGVNATATARKSQLTANGAPENDKLNTSEVIPASPQAEQPSIRPPITRLRRLVTRKGPNATNTTAQPPPTKPRNAVSQKASAVTTQNSDSATPIRNGRKRVLKISPKNHLKNLAVHASPLRKQQRTEQTKPAAQSGRTTSSNKSTSDSRHSASNIATVSPSSSVKENEKPNSSTNSNRNGTKSAAVQKTPKASKQPSTPLGQTKPKTPVAATTSASAAEAERRSQSLQRSITTRQLASKERQGKLIMTRKRLSLEITRQAGNLSPLQQPQRKKAKISKIPIRSMRTKQHQQQQQGSTSSMRSSRTSISSQLSNSSDATTSPTATSSSSDESANTKQRSQQQQKTLKTSRLPRPTARAAR